MINISICSGDSNLQSSFDFISAFNTIKTESKPLITNIIKIFEYISLENSGAPTSSLYCGKIAAILKSEELLLRDLTHNELVGDILSSDEVMPIQYYSRQVNDIALRVFYLPNREIDDHVKCLATKTMNGEFLTAFVDKTLYRADDECHYTEKYAIYSILKSYIQIKLSQYNLFVKLDTGSVNQSALSAAGVHYFYHTLGELYRSLVDDNDIIDYITTKKPVTISKVCMDNFIADSFRGVEFSYSRYEDLINKGSEEHTEPFYVGTVYAQDGV